MAISAIPKPVNPNFVRILRDSSKALREAKKVDPKERYVLLLPSAESCHVGMGFKLLDIPPSVDVFQRASELSKKNLLKLCLEGPKSELLDSIENRQLATFATTQATLAKLQHERPDVIPFCKASGGFGVGFINCLVFSGAMTFENALDLVQKQGQAMDRASKVIPSARLELRVMPATSKRRVCRAAIEHCLNLGIPEEAAVCSVTEQKYAHVMEIAGHEEAIKYLETEGVRLFKFRWCNRIRKTPQAIHTDLMRPASDFLHLYIHQRLKEDPNYLKDPETCSVYSSTSGCRLRGSLVIKDNLIKYPIRRIQTEQLIHCLFARPQHLAQPNILVLWDKKLLKSLLQVNRRAHESAKLYS